jgi:uncharacterized protein (DUF924 family)
MSKIAENRQKRRKSLKFTISAFPDRFWGAVQAVCPADVEAVRKVQIDCARRIQNQVRKFVYNLFAIYNYLFEGSRLRSIIGAIIYLGRLFKKLHTDVVQIFGRFFHEKVVY